MTDAILIEGLTVMAHCGVTDDERASAQPLRIDIRCELDLLGAQRTDDLARTVDYGSIVASVTDVVSATSAALLESFAGVIADQVLGYPSVERVSVKVAKVHPPIEGKLDSVGVEIERQR